MGMDRDLELQKVPFFNARARRDLKGVFHRRVRVIYAPGGLAESDRLDGLIDAVNAHILANKNKIDIAAHEKHPDTPVA